MSARLCRSCGERPRAPGKLRCRECLDAAAEAKSVVVKEDLEGFYFRPEDVVRGPIEPGRVTQRVEWPPDELQRLRDRVVELEAEVERLRNPKSAAERWRLEQDAIYSKLLERAAAGDVQAIKAFNEARKLDQLEEASTGQVSISDLVVPAGTIVDSTPTKEVKS